VRLLLTGASGFLGRNTLLRAPRDWQITAVFRGSADFVDFLSRERLSNVRAVRADLTDANDVDGLRAAAGEVDAVLYFAANGDPAVSVRDPVHDLRSNTLALVTFLERCPVSRFVYVSSGAVYDGLSGAVTPGTPVRPSLPYAISKLASEHYVRAFAERRGTPESYVNVRFFGAYGPYEPLRKITTRFLAAVRAGAREFAIRGDGRNLIDFMYVDDAVDGFLRLLTPVAGEPATIDFASGSPVSVGAIAETMVRTVGGGIAIKYDGRTDEYIEFRSADRSMADCFGFTPQIPFDVGFDQLRTFLAAHDRLAVRR
jgi:nucleoside-diphosphate-sugar epimerase